MRRDTTSRVFVFGVVRSASNSPALSCPSSREFDGERREQRVDDERPLGLAQEVGGDGQPQAVCAPLRRHRRGASRTVEHGRLAVAHAAEELTGVAPGLEADRTGRLGDGEQFGGDVELQPQIARRAGGLEGDRLLDGVRTAEVVAHLQLTALDREAIRGRFDDARRAEVERAPRERRGGQRHLQRVRRGDVGTEERDVGEAAVRDAGLERRAAQPDPVDLAEHVDAVAIDREVEARERAGRPLRGSSDFDLAGCDGREGATGQGTEIDPRRNVVDPVPPGRQPAPPGPALRVLRVGALQLEPARPARGPGRSTAGDLAVGLGEARPGEQAGAEQERMQHGEGEKKGRGPRGAGSPPPRRVLADPAAIPCKLLVRSDTSLGSRRRVPVSLSPCS